MKKLVVFTGAGMSAESGIQTFRGSGGLWEGVSIEEIATPQAWRRDPKKVLAFYDERRKQVLKAKPNGGHLTLAQMESDFEVIIITQNIDDLHERAGSKNVLHLHGEIRKGRSSIDENYIVEVEGERIYPGELCPHGSQLRPHVVWFGEEVPAMEDAIALIQEADYFAVIGTSLEVYPAASLIHFVPKEADSYLIDPIKLSGIPKQIQLIPFGAVQGVEMLWSLLKKKG